MVKINIDEERCIGCMACTNIASKVYEMNDQRKAQVRKDVDVEEFVEDAKKGAEMCPANAINVEEG